MKKKQLNRIEAMLKIICEKLNVSEEEVLMRTNSIPGGGLPPPKP